MLAQALRDLARRMDADPGDRSAVQISREIRLLLAELMPGGDVGREVEGYLAAISTTAFRHPGD